MKYSMVKQFYNNALDNIYSFFFKWVDFGKLMIEVFWAFLEIWQAFFLIFWNFFMYIYYLFLFIIDRGAESSQPRFFLRRQTIKKSATPSVQLSRAPNPVPAAYGATSTIKETTKQVSSAITEPVRNVTAKNFGRKSIIRRVLDFFESFFRGIKNFFLAPAKAMGNFFADRIKPVKEEGAHAAEPQKRSLIDEYIREFEEKRNG